MPGRVLVVNPNSTQAVTDAMDLAVAPLRFADGPAIECRTLAEGPPGIETQAHVDAVAGPVCRMIAGEGNRADAFVIACFSDPGLHAAREATGRPVFGIAESAILAALALGERFGIISILPASVSRHLRYVRQMAVERRLAADLPLGVSVPELADETRVGERMLATGRRLVDDHAADVLILGCAGMARYRPALEAALGLPVVEPTQAATAQAIAAICLGWRQRVSSPV